MLQLAGLGSALGLAGCLGGGNDDETLSPEDISSGDDLGSEDAFDPAELDHVEQEFRMAMCRPLDEVHWFHLKEGGFMEYELFTYEHGAWGAWSIPDFHARGDLNLRQYEAVDHADDRIEITVRDDARWSDGEPVTGRDAIVRPVTERIRTGARSFEDVRAEGPARPVDAITDFEFDGKTAVLYSDGGHFGAFPEQIVWRSFFVELGPKVPTHVEPFDSYSEVVYEEFDRAAAGDADPWDPDSDDPSKEDIYAWLDEDDWVEHFRDPENVVVNGAWTLEEIQGNQELWLRPNEHHRHADHINFDRIVAEPRCPGRAVTTALQSGQYDFAPDTPEAHVADELPDSYTVNNVPELRGTSFELNHSKDLVGDVRGRQAIFAAMDKEAIAETINPLTHDPLKVPGADNVGRPDAVTDEWVEENLQSYEYDPEFAAELMRSAGYERNSDGTWVDEDGDLVDLTIHTRASTLTLESLVVQQLEEFGIAAEYVTLESATFEDAGYSGDLAMFPGNAGGGSVYSAVTAYEYAQNETRIMRRHAYFDGDVEDNIDRMEWDDSGLFSITDDPADLEHLTVSVPPIGEFWADEDEWEPQPVVSMTKRLQSTTGDELDDLWRRLVWIYNWHLPGLPYATVYTPRFLNTEHWYWSLDHDAYEYVGISDQFRHEDLLSWGDMIFADPENPKD